MTVRKVTLPYGQKSVEIRIPEGNLVGVYSPRDVAPVDDVGAEIRRALASPIGALPLREHNAQARPNTGEIGRYVHFPGR